jgi:hypothetical protein
MESVSRSMDLCSSDTRLAMRKKMGCFFFRGYPQKIPAMADDTKFYTFSFCPVPNYGFDLFPGEPQPNGVAPNSRLDFLVMNWSPEEEPQPNKSMIPYSRLDFHTMIVIMGWSPCREAWIRAVVT